MRAIQSSLAALLIAALGAATAAEPATELGKVAAGMKAGSWAELKTEGYNRELLGNQDILVYSDRAAWDPRSEQVLFVGQDHLKPPPRFITYSAKTNAWKAQPTPAWAEPLKWFHAYENNAIDAGKGIFYHHPSASRIVHQYDIAKNAWATLPEIAGAGTGHGTALEYFPEMKGLVRVLNGSVHFYSEDKKAWSLLKDKVPMGPYHNVAIYSPTHKAVILGGGNNSMDLHKLDAEGKLTELKKAPVGIGIGQSVLAVDPVSGDLLVLHKDGKFFSFNPGTDAWKELPSDNLPFSLKGSSHSIVAAPVSNYGVTLFFTSAGKGYKVYLFKHASAKN
jgi:hypothetical protein